MVAGQTPCSPFLTPFLPAFASVAGRLLPRAGGFAVVGVTPFASGGSAPDHQDGGRCHPGARRPTRAEQTNARGARLGCFLLRPSGVAPRASARFSTCGSMAVGMAHGVGGVRRAADRGRPSAGGRNPFAGCSVCARSSTASETETPHPRSQALDDRSEQIVVIESPYEGTRVPRSVPGLRFRPECRRTLHGHRPAGATRSSVKQHCGQTRNLDSERSPELSESRCAVIKGPSKQL